LLPELAEGELLPPADPALGRARLLEAMARVLEAGDRPLVFDDVQWADAATAELIVFIARRAQATMRLAHRTTEAAPALERLLDVLEADCDLRRLALAPLTADSLQALLAELSRTAAGPPKFGAWLHARTGGNPFFALQTLRALFENRRLSATDSGWASDLDAVTIDYSELEVPARVADLVRRRLRGLSDTARRVLGVVAVCGSARDVERIAATVGLSAWATAEALAEAEGAGLLRDSRFVHDVVRESHLASLAEPLRVVLHGAVARQFADVLPAAQIAEHWWAAGQAESAVESTVATAEHGRRTGLYREAIEALERALARELTAQQHARLKARLATLLYETNDRRRAEAVAADALLDGGAPVDSLQALKVLASVALQDGRLEQARRLVERAALYDSGGDALLLQRTKLAAYDGTIAQLLPELMRYHEKLRRRPFDVALIDVLITLSYAHGHAGDTQRALEFDREAYALTTRMAASSLRVNAANNLIVSLVRAGQHAEAIGIGETVLAAGVFEGSATLRSNVAAALKLSGRFDEALKHYNDLVGSDEPTVALIARGHRIHIVGERGDAAAVEAEIAAALIALSATELPVPRASVACHILRFGSDSNVQTVLAALKPAPLDPWLAERLRAALTARGIDPTPYLHAAPDANAAH
jgi:tetratricopeptide (TPR) repeat protein